MPITENRSESPAGLNWTPQILRTGTDSRARSSFAGRATLSAEKLHAIDQELARQLKAAIDLVVRDTVIVTFGGRFNSGQVDAAEPPVTTPDFTDECRGRDWSSMFYSSGCEGSRKRLPAKPAG
jgi:enoyl-CoA hydratase/carnithine racemase